MIKAFREILRANSAVLNLVGDRVYPKVKPLNERNPSIVLLSVSEVPTYYMEGNSSVKDGRMQITCWAGTVQAATALADAVQTALESFFGTADGLRFAWIEIGDRSDVSPEIPPGQNSPQEHGIEFDAEYLIA